VVANVPMRQLWQGPATAPARSWPFTVLIEDSCHYQRGLRKLLGPGTRTACVQATLQPEPDNPRDGQAIKISAGGRIIGHLSSRQAARFRQRYGGEAIALRWARIRAGEGAGSLEVWLNLRL
jgi:hypothetical protein